MSVRVYREPFRQVNWVLTLNTTSATVIDYGITAREEEITAYETLLTGFPVGCLT